MNVASIDLNNNQFRIISDVVYRLSGIDLKEGKQSLVRARLMKRLRALRMDCVDSYVNYIKSNEGADELLYLIDEMTTNKTGFFREIEHFNFLRDHILPKINGPRMRFWSAACSSGEEPYSLAITLRESISDIDLKDCLILATDISRRMLEQVRRAVYNERAISDLPKALVRTYFNKTSNGAGVSYRVKDAARRLVRPVWLNLMGPWPMKGPFDVILCRNVMIYFDRPTQQTLIDRFWKLLRNGGYLMVGHSEGLASLSHKFHYVRAATYRK